MPELEEIDKRARALLSKKTVVTEKAGNRRYALGRYMLNIIAGQVVITDIMEVIYESWSGDEETWWSCDLDMSDLLTALRQHTILDDLADV